MLGVLYLCQWLGQWSRGSPAFESRCTSAAGLASNHLAFVFAKARKYSNFFGDISRKYGLWSKPRIRCLVC